MRMKRQFLLGTLLLIALLLGAQNRTYKVEDIPMVHLQDARRYVSNPDGILSPAVVNAIDTTLFALERETGIQTLVVAVSEIEGGDCFDFAYRLGRINGVGQKEKDNGLVILLVTGERCIQFATGYGLEGDLPDAVCKQIQVRYMNPYFKDNKWNEGMLAGVRALRAQLNGTGVPPSSEGSEDDDAWLLFAVFFCCFILVPLFLWLNIRQRKRCPQCHKHTLRQISSQTISRTGGYRTIETTYVCGHCGNVVRKQRRMRDEDDFHHRGGNGWPFLGGPFFGGGGHSGGGFGGGSFGGGDFGGGGAGSKF